MKLGDEEYTAEGPSIKKAQHTAAGEALQNTKYSHPPAKSNRVLKATKKSLGNVTPTVELNALGKAPPLRSTNTLLSFLLLRKHVFREDVF